MQAISIVKDRANVNIDADFLTFLANSFGESTHWNRLGNGSDEGDPHRNRFQDDSNEWTSQGLVEK